MAPCGWPFETKGLACPVSLIQVMAFMGKA
jgi:hypothetical protein